MNKKEQNTSSRRDSIKNMLKGLGALYVGGSVWGGFIMSAKGNKLVLRPPGALPEEDFLKACTKCGICIEVCPYDTLKVSEFNNSTLAGTPSFNPRLIPCYLCTDVPCTNECPTNALDVKNLRNEVDEVDVNQSRMGLL